jgi:carbonic anhydrase
MRITPTRLAAALLAGFATQAGAAAWQVVDSNSSVQTEIDLASAVRKDGQVTGWVQHTYTRKTTTQSGAYFVYRTMKEQVKINCAQQTTAVMMRGYFDDDGSEIASIRGNGEARAVMPDTTDQRVLTRLCNPTSEARAAKGSVRPAATPVAAKAESVDPRYMDGPAPTGPKPGIVRAKADGHDAHAPAAAAVAKPPETKAPEKADAKPADAKAAEKAEAKPAAPKAAEAPAKPVQDAHGKPVAAADAHAKPAAEAAAKPGAHGAPAPKLAARAEPPSHDAARAHKARVGAPLPPEGGPRRAPSPVSPSVALQALRATAHGVGGDAGHEAHWSYEGEFAPYRWGDMKPEFATCKTGNRQSPIDIRNPVIGEVEPIRFHYEESPLKVTNNGHTIQVDVAPGSFILFNGQRYELVQFHFHSPSEERVNGRVFDMVVHMVHKNAQGRLAVIGVLLSAGAEQATLQKVWNAMPGTQGRTRERLDVSINPQDLLPTDRTYYSYMGSLTTPPCTEGVQWLVMKTPVEISRDQISHFTALYPMNARPLQAQNDRLIKIGR